MINRTQICCFPSCYLFGSSQTQSGVLSIAQFGCVFLNNGAFLRIAVSLQMQQPWLLMNSYAGWCCRRRYRCPAWSFLSRIKDWCGCFIDNRYVDHDQQALTCAVQQLFTHTCLALTHTKQGKSCCTSATCASDFFSRIFFRLCVWTPLGGLIFEWNTKCPKMYCLPVETPGGSRMGGRKKVQIWAQKRTRP